MTDVFIKWDNFDIGRHAEGRVYEDIEGGCHVMIEYWNDAYKINNA